MKITATITVEIEAPEGTTLHTDEEHGEFIRLPSGVLIDIHPDLLRTEINGNRLDGNFLDDEEEDHGISIMAVLMDYISIPDA